MRLSTYQIQQYSVNNFMQQQSELTKTYRQISSGKEVLTPSDDPVASTQILNLNSQLRANTQYTTNVNYLNKNLRQEDAVLSSVIDNLQRVRELTVQANNDTYDSAQRGDIGKEINQLLEELHSLLNSKNEGGEFIFAGTKGATEPFAKRLDGTFEYQGDSVERTVQISDSVFVKSVDAGRDLFTDARVDEKVIQGRVSNQNVGEAEIVKLSVINRQTLEDATVVPGKRKIIYRTEDTSVSPAIPANYSVINLATGKEVPAVVAPSGKSLTFEGMELQLDALPADGDSFEVDVFGGGAVKTFAAQVDGQLQVAGSRIEDQTKLQSLVTADNGGWTNGDYRLTHSAGVWSAERYDFSTDTWAADPSLNISMSGQQVTLENAGGDALASVELNQAPANNEQITLKLRNQPGLKEKQISAEEAVLRVTGQSIVGSRDLTMLEGQYELTNNGAGAFVLKDPYGQEVTGFSTDQTNNLVSFGGETFTVANWPVAGTSSQFEVRSASEQFINALPGAYNLTYNDANSDGIVDAGELTLTDPAGKVRHDVTWDAGNNTLGFLGMQVELSGPITDGTSLSVDLTEEDYGQGKKDLLNIVRDLNSTLGNFTGSDADKALVSNTLTYIDNAIEQVLRTQTDVGARLNTVERIESANEEEELFIKNNLSQLEDLDYGSAITRFKMQDAALQAAQQSYVQLTQTNLFDYI
ncbi:flagellar hook-associated protein 3 [Allopseudospirillum japonicum]|uniref:Flagellar hook-associated protein 3 n=1 Tax=Allopseudospirillum japonicum TaxID=64971 RepID=A0A1H6QS20_9GAMM|nr:flagellar hook-associated protein FlgL [Allopseudospirillum japonicum]SEI44826.1 flagellar hook-associated protein 3 [Allopseudospirillum japonicum]